MMRGRGLVNRLAAAAAGLAMVLAGPSAAMAQDRLPAASAQPMDEDGYSLWLRYGREVAPAVPDTAGRSATMDLARAELVSARELLGRTPVTLDCPEGRGDGREGFAIRARAGALAIRGSSDLACLYGTFALLRELALGADPARLDLASAPALPLRMLNHWDNPDGSVERGYAGRSIFDWWHLPERLDRRMLDYARANASVGINGTVVNNVNASPLFLTPRYLPKLKRLANAWRPYGIRLYISARFSAPRDVGGLATADPLDPQVRAWWQAKADEIYAEIPDFGGFLVKANSEGQPGPQDYGRSHADGANMLAAALGDRGTVIWRAFVYSAEDRTDRAKQAYAEFVPLDGRFAPNVILQVKNGPIDFQPREPFHPLFGAMPRTRLMLEAQLTKEYFGFATHLAYLAPMWAEALDTDTGRGGTVAQTIRGGGMAGVANTGSDRTWSGSHFDQANWYAFGRLAWDPGLDSEAIAREWAAQTFTRDPAFLGAVIPMMLGSRQVVVDYMTPLGLTHQMDTGHHYGPGPWVCDLERPEWNPCYYSKANKSGIGFDRTASGSNALAQYAPAAAARLAADEELLLWFHHVPWDRRTRTGRSLWDELVHRYDRGVAAVDTMAATWAGQRGRIDGRRHGEVADFLAIQQREARWWRDASVAWWQSINGLPLPPGTRAPAQDAAYYRSLQFPEAPGH